MSNWIFSNFSNGTNNYKGIMIKNKPINLEHVCSIDKIEKCNCNPHKKNRYEIVFIFNNFQILWEYDNVLQFTKDLDIVSQNIKQQIY